MDPIFEYKFKFKNLRHKPIILVVPSSGVKRVKFEFKICLTEPIWKRQQICEDNFQVHQCNFPSKLQLQGLLIFLKSIEKIYFEKKNECSPEVQRPFDMRHRALILLYADNSMSSAFPNCGSEMYENILGLEKINLTKKKADSKS